MNKKNCCYVMGIVILSLSDLCVVLGAPVRSFSLKIEEPSKIIRKKEPITIGVPLERGAIKNPGMVGFKNIPTQNRLLSRWPDGSCQWVLLDFQQDLSAGQTKNLSVQVNKLHKAPTKGIKVIKKADGFLINTGPMCVEIGRAGFAPLRRIWLDTNKDKRFSPNELIKKKSDHCRLFFDYETKDPVHPKGGPTYEYIWMRKSRGGPRVHHEPDPNSVEVTLEEKGPLRTVVKVAGWFKGPDGKHEGQFILRFHFYAGKAWFRLQHTFIFSYDNLHTYLRRLAFEIPVIAGDPSKFICKPGKSLISGGLNKTASLYVEGAPNPFDHYENECAPTFAVTVDSSIKKKGILPKGWFGITGNRAKIAIGVRDFDRLYPSELSIRPVSGKPGLCFDFWPEQGGWALYQGSPQRVSNYQKMDTPPQCEPRGSAITHECIIMLADAKEPNSTFSALWSKFQNPILPFTDQKYLFEKVRNFGPIPPFIPGKRDGIESYFAACMNTNIRAVTKYNMGGLFNFGDRFKFFERDKKTKKWRITIKHKINYDLYDGFAHNNNFVDYKFWLYTLRTEFYPYRHAQETYWAHNANVSTIQWQPPGQERLLGLGMRHCAYQWGHARTTHPANNRKGWLSVGHKGYGSDTLSGWVHWNLTGDWRTLDILKVYADRFSRENIVTNNSYVLGGGEEGGVILQLYALIPGMEKYREHGVMLRNKSFTKLNGKIIYKWHNHYNGLRGTNRVPIEIIDYFVFKDKRVKSAFPAWCYNNIKKYDLKVNSFYCYSHMCLRAFAYYLTGDPQFKKMMDITYSFHDWHQNEEQRVKRFRELGFDGFLYKLSEKELFSYMGPWGLVMEGHAMQAGSYILYGLFDKPKK